MKTWSGQCANYAAAVAIKARSCVCRTDRHFVLSIILAKRIEINNRSDFIPLNLNKFDYKQFKNLFSVLIGTTHCHICSSVKR